MALNFPSSPTNGQTYEGYQYDSAKGAWVGGRYPLYPALVADLNALPTASSYLEGSKIHVDSLNVDFMNIDNVWVQVGQAVVASTATRDTEYAKASSAYLVDGVECVVTASPRITFTYHTSGGGVVTTSGWFPTAGALPFFRQTPSSTQSVATSTWTLTDAIWGASESLVEFTSYTSGVLTVKHTGLYLVQAMVSYPTGGSANRATQITINSTSIDTNSSLSTANANSNRGVPAISLARLVAGDTVRVYTFHTIGTSQSIQTLHGETNWTARYLGPA